MRPSPPERNTYAAALRFILSSTLEPSAASIPIHRLLGRRPHGRRLRRGDPACSDRCLPPYRPHARPTRCPARQGAARYFMPDAAASKIVTVVGNGTAAASIVVLTEAVAVKETGPKATIEHFGEVYAFSPNFIAVHRDEPTRITLWNLQPDDEHDFMLEDPHQRSLRRRRADASAARAALEDLVRLYLPSRGSFRLPMRRASAGDERTNPGAAAALRW